MLSEHHDLRSGDPPWREADYAPIAVDALPARSDVVIVGAGIMGATLAERLTADGHDVALLDRRPPATGSTAASTAHVMWAADLPLLKLAAQLGEADAMRRWTRTRRVVEAFAERIDALGIDCARHDRPTVYLAGNVLDSEGLRAEAGLHARAGLPSRFLDAAATAQRFAIAPRASIVSEGGFEVEPTRLARGLLETAQRRGARLHVPCDVVALSPDDGKVRVNLADGRQVEARRAIFAGGYERAPLLLPAAFGLLSTFAIATAPDTAAGLWREKAMIWEASDPYLYIRSTADGRVIAGGEDMAFTDPRKRDALMPGKAGAIAAGSAALLGEAAPLAIDRIWSATFGSSPDGFPAIGPAANLPGVWVAQGFGGNGIAFAALAAELIAADFSGRPDPDAPCFDPYRFRAGARQG